MIIRIVKMTFQAEQVAAFVEVFNASKERIRAFPGCNRLELLQDVNASNVFFTYSFWDSEQDLEHYRHSEVFKSTWAKTKPLFAARPEAWSTAQLVQLP